MTQQVNGTEQETGELSDAEQYAKEWDEDDATSGDSSKANANVDDNSNATDQEKATSTATVTEGVVSNGHTAGSPKSSPTDSAESGVDDIWAGATEAQRVAYNNAHNGLNAMKGRAKASSQKQSGLEKELQKSNAELAEINRQKGTYETEHPELFNEMKTLYASNISAAAEGSSEEGHSAEMTDDIRVVFKAHPDANAVMASQDWVAFQNTFTDDQTRQFDSEDPADFIQLMTDYKVQEAVRKSTPSKNDLLLNEAAGHSGGSSSQPNSKRSAMTAQEAYDDEWDAD